MNDTDREIWIKYYHIQSSKKKSNNGFILLYDYDSWPTGTLRSRGYLNPSNRTFMRRADAEERKVVLESYRLKSLQYRTWDELENDERRIGTSDEIIEKMRIALIGN